MAYSTLAALPAHTPVVTATPILAAEENSQRNTENTFVNSLRTEAIAQENNRASSTEPTDKLEGQIWCDTTLDPAVLKYYKDGAAVLETLAGLTLTQTMTNKTLTSPTISGPTITGVTKIPNGTAAIPSLSFTGDTNTGLYSVGGGFLGLSITGVSRFQLTTSGIEILNGGVKTDPNGTNEFIRTLRKEIGDWNMDTTTAVNIAHGLTLAKIRNFWAIVRNDADTVYDHLLSKGSTSNAGDVRAGTTNIELTAFAGGFFDNTNYDATSFNRGWIYIEYAI